MTHEDADPLAHARHIQEAMIPAMVETREAADHLETVVTAEFWPLPTYRELLFLK